VILAHSQEVHNADGFAAGFSTKPYQLPTRPRKHQPDTHLGHRNSPTRGTSGFLLSSFPVNDDAILVKGSISLAQVTSARPDMLSFRPNWDSKNQIIGRR
jgi:hypothetical protein